MQPDFINTSEIARAPGQPGELPRWAPASKDGVGTALGVSPVWFTVGRGAVEEVFFPSPDQPRIAGLWMTMADGIQFFSDERTDANHGVDRPDDTVPLYRLTSTCPRGRYVLVKTIYTDPDRDVLIHEVAVDLQRRTEANLAVHVHLDARLSNEPGTDTAWIARHDGQLMLFCAWRRSLSGPGMLGRMGGGDGRVCRGF